MKEYSSNSFKTLTDYESIRKNTGMYIGSTSDPTHLIGELLDNALDEALAGFANIIIVTLDTKNNLYSVVDNGRGIPIEDDVPITISTKLHSGSKFKGSKEAYEVCSGLHGVGLAAVNALSEFYKIEVIRNSVYSIFEFDNFNLIKKFSVNFNLQPFSTRITFKPDKNIFENLLPNIDRIRERLLVASAHMPDASFVLVVDDSREIIKITDDEYFKSYFKDEETTDIINFEIKDKKIINDVSVVEKLNIKLCYSLNGTISPKIISSVNLLPVEEGGTHIKLLKSILKDIFVYYGKKLNKNFDSQDIFCGLRAYIDLYLVEPEFGGQIKGQLINRKSYLENLFNKLQLVLKNYFNKNQNDLILILNKFEEYRSNFNTKKVQNNSPKKLKNTKLKDCKRRDGELFIVEGDSAAGSLIQCRNSDIHAIMPLKGKPPTIDLNKKKKSLLVNEEIKEIISALGTGIGSNFDIAKLRYSKIILCSDSDPDGNHINCLLMSDIRYLLPELVRQGYLYICQTPLFAINKGKTFIPLWTKEELDEARNKNLTITRYKGIGEFNPWQLEICALTEKRKLIQVTYDDNFDKIIQLLLDSEMKRLLLEGNFTLE